MGRVRPPLLDTKKLPQSEAVASGKETLSKSTYANRTEAKVRRLRR